MCYICLFELNWEPEQFRSLSKADKAFVAASFKYHHDKTKPLLDKLKT